MPKLKAALIGFGLGIALAFGGAFAVLAADKGGPKHQDIVAPANWTGPYIGAGVGWNVGLVSGGGPVGIGSDGGSVSALAGYDKQFGNLVAGVGLGAGMFFGDLESVGVNYDLFAFTRLGFLVTNNAMLYGKVGYGRLDTDAGGINGFRLGPGVELRFPNSPFGLQLEYQLGIHDVDSLAPGAEARSHSFLANWVWRF